jgi:chromate transport protein ChrA
MQQHHVGIFVGLILGLALVLTSFGEMLVVALAGVIGWIVMRTISGDVDLGDL